MAALGATLAAGCSQHASTPLKPVTTRYDSTMSGQPLAPPPTPFQLLVTQATVPAGHVVACHRHSWPRYVFVQSGHVRVTDYDARRVAEFSAGQTVVEPIGQWHQAEVLGSAPAILVSFDLVPPGGGNSTPWPQPPPATSPCRPWAR
jgi:quercetin dioxygenase-like cupin family protein